MDAGVPMTEARGRLAELVEHVRRTGESVHLTRHGRTVAVLVDPHEWDLASAALSAAEDAEAVRAYDAAIAADDGTRVPIATVLAELAEDERADRPEAG